MTIEDIRFCSSVLRGRACKPEIWMNAAILNNADWGGIIAALGTMLNRVSKLAKKSPGELSNITARSFYPEFLL